MPIFSTIVEDVKLYLNIYHSEDDMLIENLCLVACDYIMAYTGQDKAWLNDVENEATVRFLIMQIATTMYESRGLDTQQVKENMMLKSMLNLYSINQL